MRLGEVHDNMAMLIWLFPHTADSQPKCPRMDLSIMWSGIPILIISSRINLLVKKYSAIDSDADPVLVVVVVDDDEDD